MRRAALLGAWLLPAIALACPVCGLPPQETRWAYQLMSVIMSLLPLAMIGGGIAFLVYRVKKAEAAEQALLQPKPPAEPVRAPASPGDAAPAPLTRPFGAPSPDGRGMV